MLRAFLASLKKDFKSLFRSWASIFLVVIGPLIVMFVLMLAFSNIGFNDIRIGHTSAAGTKYGQFLPQLSYLGNFVEYPSVWSCSQDLKKQDLHLCLEPTAGELNIYFDNSRELISLILLNQIRVATNAEKERIMEDQAESFLLEIDDVHDFLGESERFSGILLDDLQVQRDNLLETRDEIISARNEVKFRIDQLTTARTTLAKAKINAETTIDREYSDALNSFYAAEDALYDAYVVASAAGETALANELWYLRNNLGDTRRTLSSSSGPLYTGLNQMDIAISELDYAISELQTAEEFLYEKGRDIDSAVNTIDVRSIELRELQNQISSKRRRFDTFGTLSVEEMVRPLDISYSPLFLGSNRIRSLSLDVDLTWEEQQRLLNFGTVQTFLPLVISLLVCFIAIILANITLLDEIHSSAFLRNQILPSSWLISFFSRFITVVSITFLQVIIILFISYFVFFLDVLGSIHTLFLVLLLLISSYALIGMAIAYFVKTKTTSLLVSAFFLIITILLGGIVYPVERMAPMMSYVAKFVPFTSGISMLQQSIFYNAPLYTLLGQLLHLFIILVACLLVFLLSRKIFFSRYAKGK